MIYCSFLLILVFLTSHVTCYSCNGAKPINPPFDINHPTYYPAGWSEGQEIPHLDTDQNCMITVNVPSGIYANVTFYKVSKLMDEFTESTYVVYSNNKISKISPADYYPFVFVSPSFKVGIKSATLPSGTRFAFKIVWAYIPDFTKNYITIIKGNSPVAVTPNNMFNVFVASANSQMSLSMFSLIDPSQNNLLRQSAVFAGDTFGTNFVGTLETILASSFSITTPFNRMSVYTFGLNNFFNYPLYMGQDIQDLRQYSEFRGASCPSTGDCEISWDGKHFDEMIVTVYNGIEIVKSFDIFPENQVVNVYESMMTNSTLVAQLTSSNYRKQLPLKVYGYMKMYQFFGTKKVTMTLTRDTSNN